jgi:DMSO/TMAO reductase YedYZ heme-binding membrane subunit
MSWYVARAGGFLAWGLSAFSILWGLLISSRALGKRISGPRLLDLHRFVGGLSVVFVFVHILALRLHVFEDLKFGFKELLVPMASDWHPGAVAYGIVAFYLLIAVEITSLLRRRISATLWRRVHYGGFAVFLLGSIHALKVGTDVQNPVIWWPSAVMCAAIVGLAVTRAMSAAQDSSAKAPDIETELFGALDVQDFAPPPVPVVPVVTQPVLVPFVEPVAQPTAPPPVAQPVSPIAEVLATTTTPKLADLDRAALLERTRQSLERLDITAYPRAELPAELLTTRPEQPAPPVETSQADAALPTRPTDIALRYARLRNPAKPPVAPQPSFQAVIPEGVPGQSSWGQPPAGRGTPAPEEPAPAAEVALPVPVEAVVEAPPIAEAPAVSQSLLAIAPLADPPAPVGLPDPSSRTAHEDQWAVPTTDQWAVPTSSLDWRTPTRPATPPPASPSLHPFDEPDTDGSNGDGGEPLVATRSGLPSRTPQRLARSTEPARTPLDWKPQRVETAPMGGAPPPPEPDPETGEVPSEQYRTWLREWLAFAENYEG